MFSLPSVLLKFVALILGIEQNQSFPPPLSPSEEKELFRKAREGSMRARDKIIEHNLRLVSHIVKKYYASSESADELISIGSIGLIKATDTFKYELGTKFATYAARCIQNEILMYFRSRKKREGEVSINDTIDIDKDGNPLTYLDIISVDETITDDIELKIYTEKLTELIKSLNPREEEIIVLRYGLRGFKPETQKEVARHLGISRSYVSRIEKRALMKLRDGFGKNIPELDL
ncbi:MAG: RNA polymerase sporulation sigma factor SigK [Clostridia bacterium]|nr:RNA polymerase sporulation sigma factor SigK [Clostridia bacterium]